MWALVEDSKISKVYSKPTQLTIVDIKYPSNIHNLWSEAELKAIGVYTVIEDNSNLKDMIIAIGIDWNKNAGTEFYYFPDLKIQARKGLTLIWPAGWTHTHRGVVSNVDEKYIVTGWFSFYDK